jgi:hypothetical protein
MIGRGKRGFLISSTPKNDKVAGSVHLSHDPIEERASVSRPIRHGDLAKAGSVERQDYAAP